MLKKKSFNPILLPILLGIGVCLALFTLHFLGFFETGFDEERVPAGPPESRTKGFKVTNSRIDGPSDDRVSEGSKRTGTKIKKQPKKPPFPGIRGKAVDSTSGIPLNPFRAWVCRDGDGSLREKTRLDPGKVFRNQFGMVTFNGLEKGQYSILIRCSGYKDLVVPGLRVPQKEEFLDFRLHRGTHICGKVIDDRGNPVRNIMVFITYTPVNPDDPAPRRTSTTTDRSGFFLFGDLPAGTYDIFLDSVKEPIDQRRGLFLASGSSLDINFDIPSYNRMEFRITASTGAPLENATIRLRSEKHRFSAKTDLMGWALLNRVPPGEYVLTISKKYYGTLKEEYTLVGTSGSHVVSKYMEPN